ncbi:hypothetical protein Y695_03602 [Hydrogenophaga sp. T4]|nr:hypothetical protein Y695_03602 [Hydrogenophaga sp. T4]
MCLVFRSGWDVMVLQTTPGMAALVEGLLENALFGEALDQALVAEPGFDLSQALAILIRHELLIGAELPH